jgi:hypothetical protein
MIQTSPNQQARTDWSQFVDRWGITGNFVQKTVSVATLVKLVQNFRMYLSKYSEADVENRTTISCYHYHPRILSVFLCGD